MRMIRPFVTATLVSFAPVALGVPAARAQSTAEDPTTVMARARFREGVEFFDKGEFEQARASFLQAYALKKHPAVLLNLAWSCLKSGHAMEAEGYFRQFLADGRDITDKQRADANDGLAQSTSKLGRIEVVAPAGTEITVDGERAGVAPLAEPLAVEPGAHTIRFKGADFGPETQSITTAAGEKVLAHARGAAAPSPPPVARTPEAPAPAASAQPPPQPAPSPSAPVPAPAAIEPPRASVETSAAAKTAVSVPLAHEPESVGIFAPPRNVVPVVLLGVGAAVGYGLSVAFFLFKQSAQDKANSIAFQINQPTSGGCAAHPDACNAYHADLNDIDQDATWGNVTLAVGLAATAGAVVYWLVADKGGARDNAAMVVTPILETHTAGATVSGRF